MKYLADTHLLLWAGNAPEKLSKAAREIFKDTDNDLFFSTVSIWETAIKYGRGRDYFTVPPATLRRGLLTTGFQELTITSEHAIAVSGLPSHHGDPFDRLLVAQAMIEGLTLLTVDKTLAKYPGTLRV
jgi:PIN domain nuclease of toxin-antitoxin system